MPWREQRRVCSIAVAAARQRAVDLAVAEPWDIAELSLERRRQSLSLRLFFKHIFTR